MRSRDVPCDSENLIDILGFRAFVRQDDMRERSQARNAGLDRMLDRASEPLSSFAHLYVSLLPQFCRRIHVDMEERRPERLDHEGMILGKAEPIDRQILTGRQV
jgi:hypothetical protein